MARHERRVDPGAKAQTVDLPELTSGDVALLSRFRAAQSPPPLAAARVLRRLEAGLGEAAPIAAFDPWFWLRSGAIALGLAAAALVLLLGGTRAMQRADAGTPDQALDTRIEPAPQPSVATPPLGPAPTPRPAVVVPPAEIEPSPAVDEPVPPTPAAVRPRARSGGRASETTDIAAEVALVSAARREGSPAARLALLARYRREFPRGAFVEEVEVLAIESNCALGRTDVAADLVAAFVRDHADSAYAAIARRGCPERAPP